MTETPSITIYDAAAGSGKTFALVQHFLTLILSHPQPDYYKRILAITFTNKAVAEMKSRIVSALIALSKDTLLADDPLRLQVVQSTNLSSEEIQTRATRILDHLLNNYALFNVETIDRFNHRLIRTFAKDLQLTSNFEVSLDTDTYISQAVDQLLDHVGQDEDITRALLDFALGKLDDDKSWDIALDLNKMAKRITYENDRPFLEQLQSKSISDFRVLAKHLSIRLKSLIEQLSSEGASTLALLNEHQVPEDIFLRATLPNYFRKRASGEYFRNKNSLAIQFDSGSEALYKKNTATDIVERFNSIFGSIHMHFEQCEALSAQIRLTKNILKNLIPVATLNLVNQELQMLKKKENILLISEFNQLIYKQIKDQPAPYIYERLGERYRHFFVDEFQDTSLLQWANLIPLVQNALSQQFETGGFGSALLVGDAKQAIYRWRGGFPEQFMELTAMEEPRQLQYSIPLNSYPREVRSLKANYRSGGEIVAFNNAFFEYASSVFSDELHQHIYTRSIQQTPIRQGGYVHLQFVTEEDKAEAYHKCTLAAIERALEVGFKLNDICILTRKKKEGVAISQYLIENGMAVVSEETLLLNSATVVQTMIDLLTFSRQPRNQLAKLQLLEFFYHHLAPDESQHTFNSKLFPLTQESFWKELGFYGLQLNPDRLNGLPLYEACEYLIHQINFDAEDAYLLGFMEVVFEYAATRGDDVMGFLNYWNDQKENFGLKLGGHLNAIRVMTIHKSKGLEFPVVIFPYADVDLYAEVNPTTWFPYNKDNFENVLIDYSSDVVNYGTPGAQISDLRRSQLELDQINLLYVALTRAEEALFVIGEDTDTENPTSYNGLLKHFVRSAGYQETPMGVFSSGILSAAERGESGDEMPSSEVIEYQVSLPSDHQLSLASVFSNEDRAEAVALGNLLHDTMAKIKTLTDVDHALSEMDESNSEEEHLFEQTKYQVHKIVSAPALAPLFDSTDIVYTERDIVTPASVIRPDRINLHSDGSISVLDYKTGTQKAQDESQILHYGAVLKEMNYSLRQLLLVYVSDAEIVINKI